jgi:hypothetical protein
VLVSPPFAVDGEPPYSLSFTSRCVLSSLAGTTAFVYLEDLDDGSQATLASKNDLESNNFVQHTFALPLETEPRGKLFRLRFQVSAVTTATNPFYWLVDDVSVTALLP